MTKHIILWQLKDEFNESEKAKICADIKKGLEGLYGKIDGLTEIKVITDKINSSNADLMLDSTFVDVASYNIYKTHPAHVAVADGLVRPNVKTRLCIDYEL